MHAFIASPEPVIPTGGWVLNYLLGYEPGVMVRVAWDVTVIGVVFLPAVSLIAFLSIWMERKVAGRIQHRHGPNRVGPLGILQSLADGIKLVGKEDLTPAGADRWLFRLAPYLAFAPVFAAFLAIPFGPDLVFEKSLSVGLFWILAVLSIEVIGVILAGWSSNSKWSVYGAMREACQLISYEIPLGVSILIVVVITGTLDLNKLAAMQSAGLHAWFIFHQPFALAAFVTFFIASLASNKRAPFDLPESESEIVAGYHTEYSGLRFSLFYLAEYSAMFVMGAVMTALFLGAWNDPFGILATHIAAARAEQNLFQLLLLNVAAAHVFVGKTVLLVFIQMWVRWTLPRPRIDQVLHACFKVMLPMTLVLLLGSALWQLLVTPDSIIQRVTNVTLTGLGLGLLCAIIVTIGFAFASGRRNQQRLSPFAGRST